MDILKYARLSNNPDECAPDNSEIRFLSGSNRGSMVHCSLPIGQISTAVRHRTVEELWYFLSGQGLVWREYDGIEEVKEVYAGVSLNIPLGTKFQFKNTGDKPLSFIIATMPPWPGNDEAIVENSYWK
jgi:mannose-6-phosphate isomerase-like protein (cupin superfamily)